MLIRTATSALATPGDVSAISAGDSLDGCCALAQALDVQRHVAAYGANRAKGRHGFAINQDLKGTGVTGQ